MKSILSIGLFLAFGSASHAQFSPAGSSLVRSLSGQFVVHGPPQTLPSSGLRTLATNENYLELEPALLAVSSERIKQALNRELGESSAAWRGKIHLHLQAVRGENDPVTIVSERFRDGWDYRIALPQIVERQRFVRAFVQSLLRERANRRAGDRAAEIPLWLSEGLTQHLLNSSEIQLFLPPPRWGVHGLEINPLVIDARAHDPLASAKQRLRERPPLTLEELSWPTGEKLAGEAGEAFRRSAQLFVTELLRLADGRDCLRAMLDELPACYNWQTAFFHAFHAHFARQLDLEKWWSLQVTSFTGRDLNELLTVADSWSELDQVLRTPVEVRRVADEMPERSEVTLQFILREWDQVQQTPALQARLRDLELMRLRAAPELGELIGDYHDVLGSYLRQRDKVGLIFTTTARDTSTKLKILARDTAKQLDALDARRLALRPETNSPPDTLEAAARSPKP